MSDATKNGADVPTDTITTLEMLNDNPEAVYARLRQTMPIARIQALNGRILFTKAQDTFRVKTDAEHFGSYDTTTPMQRAFGGHTLMRKDGCPHIRERRAMEPPLEANGLQKWEGNFANIAEGLLDGLKHNKTADLVADFCTPLSAGYLRHVLGLRVDDKTLFSWANALVRGAMNASFDPAIFEVSDRANDEMNAHFDEMIAAHRNSPDGSALSAMANQADALPLSQIQTNMKICIGGAVLETRDALASTMLGLLSNAEQLQNCIQNADWEAACEEGLRWVAPIQASPRIVKKSLVMRGFLIPEGETVMAVQASANRDEDIWENPEKFDITRPLHRNQTFGDGAHQCLGGGVYRLLASKIALPMLFDRFPNMALAPNPEVALKGFAFRGPATLPVVLAA
ncbi:cytochrome P450 [Falsihalocynthiibacter sp. SS001]|uniref:cytochrome P450 n=1 Tax=Falsihalocynthiibacter sp. SS001 TaxID=3349698 RepID=UPI0036D2724C